MKCILYISAAIFISLCSIYFNIFEMQEDSMASNPIVFITGANAGLGLQTIKSLCKSTKAYTILLGGRSTDKANAAAKEVQAEFLDTNSVIATVQVDIEDDDSISRAFEFITKKYGRLDVLINNAGKSNGSCSQRAPRFMNKIGGQFDQQYYLGNMSWREVWNKSWDVNATGTYILTHIFVPLLLKSSDPRLIFITSGMSTLAEHNNTAIPLNKSPGKGWPKEAYSITAYRSSKAGMNMMMREWARILREDGVKVWCISPGFLATGLGGDVEMNKKMGAEDPVLGANFVRDVVEGARDQEVGKVIRRGDIQPW